MGQARQNTRDAGWEFHGWRKAERREDSQMEISRDVVTGQFLGSTGSLGMLEPGKFDGLSYGNSSSLRYHGQFTSHYSGKEDCYWSKIIIIIIIIIIVTTTTRVINYRC